MYQCDEKTLPLWTIVNTTARLTRANEQRATNTDIKVEHATNACQRGLLAKEMFA